MSNSETELRDKSEVKDRSKDPIKKKEKEAAENTEYQNTLEEIQSLYQNLVQKSREQFDNKAKEFITRLYEALKKPTPDKVKMSIAEMRRHITHDVRSYWSKQWIEKSLPEELTIKVAENTTTNTSASGQQTQQIQGEGTGDPKEDLIKELKQEAKLAKENVVTLQKLQEKNNKRMSQMTEQLADYSNQVKDFKENQAILKPVKESYNKQLGALELVITGISIKRIEDFVKTAHALNDKVKITVKLGEKGSAVIDSIKKI